MAVDPSHPMPLYHQLKTHLVEEILAGTYQAGDRIPTEHELCQKFGISRTPVNRALSELADEGVILRQRKRGSFVNPHWVRRPPLRDELRVVLPDGPWADLVSRAVGDRARLNIATVHLDDLRLALMRHVAEGRAPDLALVDSVWVPELAGAGFLWPLEELDADWMELDYFSDFLPPLHEVNVYQGKTYGVQAEADIAGVWYRKSHLEEIGDEPPTDWTELIESASRLVDFLGEDQYPIVLPGGARAGEATTYCLHALLASNGARVLDSQGVILDDERTVTALRFLRDLVERGLLSGEAVAFDRDRPAELMASERATFMFGGSYQAGHLAELTGEDIAPVTERFGFMPVPAGPNGAQAVLAGGMAYVIPRQAQHPKNAMGFLEHLLSDRPLADLARATAQIPPRRAAASQAADGSPLIRETASMLDHALVRPAIVEHVRVSTQLQNMVAAVLTGTLGPATVTERTAEFIGAITGMRVIHRGHATGSID